MKKPVYRITIHVDREEEVLQPRQYIREEERDQNMIDNDEQYGQQVPAVKIVNREIYSQVVEELNLAEIIAAVNAPNIVMVD